MRWATINHQTNKVLTDHSKPRVVYFDQQTGALQAVCWLKSIFLMLNQLFPSLTEQNKEKKIGKLHKNMRKHAILKQFKISLKKNHIFPSSPPFGCQPAFKCNTALLWYK